MERILYNGKTQKEWLEQLSENMYMFSLGLKEGNIQDRSKEIFFYFDNNGNLLPDETVNILKYFYKTNGFLAKELKKQLNINDDWEENYICIDSENLCQLLFFMNREDIFSTIGDMINCLCK